MVSSEAWDHAIFSRFYILLVKQVVSINVDMNVNITVTTSIPRLKAFFLKSQSKV
jgi:hypothetical protein